MHYDNGLGIAFVFLLLGSPFIIWGIAVIIWGIARLSIDMFGPICSNRISYFKATCKKIMAFLFLCYACPAFLFIIACHDAFSVIYFEKSCLIKYIIYVLRPAVLILKICFFPLVWKNANVHEKIKEYFCLDFFICLVVSVILGCGCYLNPNQGPPSSLFMFLYIISPVLALDMILFVIQGWKR